MNTSQSEFLLPRMTNQEKLLARISILEKENKRLKDQSLSLTEENNILKQFIQTVIPKPLLKRQTNEFLLEKDDIESPCSNEEGVLQKSTKNLSRIEATQYLCDNM